MVSAGMHKILMSMLVEYIFWGKAPLSGLLQVGAKVDVASPHNAQHSPGLVAWLTVWPNFCAPQELATRDEV